MADYRQVHMRMWKDPWISDLEPGEKLVFLYLLTNERTSVSGIYELPLKYIAFETGLDQDTVSSILAKFEVCGKIRYENGVVWIKNYRKYQENKSPKVKQRIAIDLKALSGCSLMPEYLAYYRELDTVSISHIYSMDTLSENDHRIDSESDDDHESESDSTADELLTKTIGLQTAYEQATSRKMLPSEWDYLTLLAKRGARPEQLIMAINEITEKFGQSRVSGVKSIYNPTLRVLERFGKEIDARTIVSQVYK